MTLPGFSAETSLYKTTVHYGLTGASVPSGVMLQLFPFGRDCCPPGFHCCGECSPSWGCVADPFLDQGCVPLGVHCQ
jgi:hypothetical protein